MNNETICIVNLVGSLTVMTGISHHIVIDQHYNINIFNTHYINAPKHLVLHENSVFVDS